MKYTKLFSRKDSVPLDDRINAWVDENGERFIKSIVPLSDKHVLVLYTTSHRGRSLKTERSGEVCEAVEIPKRTLKPLPLKEGATSPTWEATMRDQEGERKAPVMAGVFPVPEGFKMHPEDSEPAPSVLLAKNTDLSQYADLFGNLGLGIQGEVKS
jgi:hypothetical protein